MHEIEELFDEEYDVWQEEELQKQEDYFDNYADEMYEQYVSNYYQSLESTFDNSCINELNISNTAKNHIQSLFDACITNNIKTITIYDIKRYCSNNKIQYQSIYVLFRRIFGTDFITNLNDLYKKYANL